MPKPNYASSQMTHFKTHSKKQMQPMLLCILSEKNTQDTLEKKWIGFAHTLRKRLKTHNMEKSNKCNQCAYKSSHVDNLRTYLKTPMQL